MRPHPPHSKSLGPESQTSVGPPKTVLSSHAPHSSTTRLAQLSMLLTCAAPFLLRGATRSHIGARTAPSTSLRLSPVTLQARRPAALLELNPRFKHAPASDRSLPSRRVRFTGP